MWTSTLDLSPRRVILTNLLGRFWRGAYFSAFAPLRVLNTPRQPLPDTGWVRVRNRLAGICGSDLHLIYADGDLRVAPAALPGHASVYLGHEVVGEVIEIGDDVQQLQVGDRVVLQHGVNCLSAGVQPLCRSCASGNYGLCERGTLPGPQPIGGGWSEEMLLHEQQLFRVPSDMTDAQAVLLEPSAVAVHTVLRHIPQAGDRVLIIGAGTIGLLTLQAIRALAPQTEISVQARYPFQIEKATRMGAAHIIYPQDSYAGVQQATQAQLYTGLLGNQMLLGGYDVIYDTIGNQRTIHNALRWARAKATVVLVGLSLHLMHIDLTPVWYQEINLIGTLGQGMETWPIGSDKQRSTFHITTDMMMNGLLHPERLITHHFALNNYRQALMAAIDKRDQRAIKVVFDYSLLPASVVPNVRASARHRRQTTVDFTSPTSLITKDLALKEPVQPLSEYTVTRMPITPVAPTTTIEQLPRVVPTPATPATVVQEQALLPAVELQQAVSEPELAIQEDSIPSLSNSEFFEDEQPVREETPVGTNVSAIDSEPVEEQLEAPPVVSEVVGQEHVFPIQPAPPVIEPEQEALGEVEEPLYASAEAVHVPSHVEEEITQHTSPGTIEQGAEALGSFGEEPLNDLEWLDVMHAEQNMPEEQYVPDVADAPAPLDIPPLPEEIWLEEEPTLYEETLQENQHKDLLQEGDEEELHTDAEETAAHASRETLFTTKTTKAVTPGKSRSKNRHKGRNTTGSFRS